MSAQPLALRMPLAGTQLVEASAGTGKTHTLVLLLLRAIVAERMTPGELVAVTYTRAAAAELRERMRAVLALAARRAADPAATDDGLLAEAIDAVIVQALDGGEETRPMLARRLRAAELALDQIWLGTVHSYCQRLLAEFGPLLGVPGLGDEVDAGDDLLAQACADVWRQLQSPSDGFEAVARANRFDSPEALLVALKPILALSGDALIPPAPSGAEQERHRRSFHAAWADVRDAQAGLPELLALLRGRQRVYGLSTDREKGLSDAVLDQVEADLCAYLLAEPGSVPIPARLHRLSRDGLASIQTEAQRRKGTSLPARPLPDALQALADAEMAWQGATEAALMHHIHAQVRARLARAGFEQGRTRFDDLIGQVAVLLADPAVAPRLQRLAAERWRLAVIDEFQDTDADQYAIFRGLFAGRLILVGDPKQAIYGFRGGDVHAYRVAAEQADGRHRLDASHRSEPAVVEAVNRLFDSQRVAEPFIEPFIEYHPVRCAYDGDRGGRLVGDDGASAAGLYLWPVLDEGGTGVWSSRDRAQAAVIAQIGQATVELLDAAAPVRVARPAMAPQRLRPGDIAVLCNTNAQCDQVAAELRARNVPVSRAGDAAIEQAAQEDLRRLLSAWLAPSDAGRLRALALSGLYGLTLAQLPGDGDESPFTGEQMTAHMAQLRLVERGRIGQALIQAIRAGAAIANGTGEGQARIDAWLRLVDRLAAWSGPGIGLNDLYLRYRRWQSGSVSGRDESLPRPVADSDAVQVMTIHGSKGLEFGIVFVPFLWDRGQDKVPPPPGSRSPVRFHRPLDDALVADVGGPDYPSHHALAQAEERAEAMRRAYVALTRARHRGYLPIALGRNQWRRSPLAHLLPELDPDDALAMPRRLARLAGTGPAGPVLHVMPAPDGQARLPAAAGTASGYDSGAPPPVPRPVPDDFRLLSYSRLVHSLVDPASGGEPVPDEIVLSEPIPSEHDWRPRGANFGSCFHTLVERLDAHAFDAGQLARIADRHGYTGEREQAFLERLWRDTVAAELPGGIRIADLDRDARAVELEFFLPLHAFDARSFGRVLAEEPRYHRPPERWPADLAAARGYLRGFIDLIYHVGERHYVLDYKTNDLGTDPAAYGDERLEAAIRDHDYDLQYLLYLVALQRLLRSRLGAGYDYERHVGGAVYLFVRGLGDGGGLHHDRPPRRLVDALEAVLTGARP